MPVQISVETEITLAGLVAKKNQGYLVEETPHVGNLSVSTLAMLTLGFGAKLVDLNIGSKDNLFYPHLQISGGASKEVADPNVMSTHSKVRACGTPLSEFHLQPLSKCGLNIFTHSNWIASRQETIIKIIEATLRGSRPGHYLWGRYVNANGYAGQRLPSQNLIDRVHKVTVPPTSDGWVVPNPLNILFDLVCGALERGKSTIYMLSGQSMYKYVMHGYRDFGPMDQMISNLYDEVRFHFFGQLPANLTVRMVPIPVVRHFVAPMRHKSDLDHKLHCYETVCAENARCGKKLSTGELSVQTITRLKKQRAELLRATIFPTSHICADSETGMFYSQHDLAQNRDAIYIPDHVMEMPIRVMLNHAAHIKRLSA